MAQKVDLIMDQGTSFAAQFEVVDDNQDLIDFSNFTLESQIRKTYTSSNNYSFSISASSNGIIILTMNSATTNTIPFGRYVYDIEIKDNFGFRDRIVEGMLTVTPQVTR